MGNSKIYVTKLVHAGAPENFVFYATAYRDGQRAVYLLSGGASSYTTLSNGTTIKPRNWDMYKDVSLDKDGYIKKVYPDTGIRLENIGCQYWLSREYQWNYSGWEHLYSVVYANGKVNLINARDSNCFGIRLVVEMNEGVYIASGDGTEDSPYVLGKEPAQQDD